MKVTIDSSKCTNDLECTSACPMEVIVNKDGKAVVDNMDNCIDCQACVAACPVGAVTVEPD